MSKKSSSRLQSRSTLHDVARMAGVSPSTVSSVMSGQSANRRISDETVQKVQSAAAQLGYTPNLLHRSMRRGNTRVLSLFNAFRRRDIGDLYFDRTSAAIEQAAGDLGYDVLVHSNFKRSTEETFEFLNGGFADGLLLFGSAAEEPLLPLIRHSNLPTVLIGPRHEDPTLSQVIDDETMGMGLVADELVTQGHRNIAAVVDMPEGALDPTGRIRRLRILLAKKGIEFDERNILVYGGSPATIVDKLAGLNPRPTALFVWHDYTAYRILEACEERGMQIPGDLSILSYDGIVWPATSAGVVASVEVPLKEMAATAAELLVRLIQGEQGPLSKTMPVRFIKGTTLGPADPISSNLQRRN